MDSITELAKKIKDNENPSPYSPMFGKIISLPELKIQVGERLLLGADDIKSTIDLYETTECGGRIEYINLDNDAVLLPYSDDNKFIVIGVIR